MFIRFCKQASNRDLKKRYFSNTEPRRTEAPISLSSIEQRTSSSDEEDETILKENGSTAQTVDLVADCPEEPAVDSPAGRQQGEAATSPAGSPSMGQRPSSGLLRPKISLTWVLRGQQFHSHDRRPHQHCVYQQQQQQQQQQPTTNSHGLPAPSNNGLLNNQHSVVVELHREKDTNPAKEREEKERAFRRSVKSTKSAKSVKSVKSVKNAKKNSDKNKERNKENIEKLDRQTILQHTYDIIERADAVTEKNQLNETPAQKDKREAEKDCQVIKEPKDADKEKVKRAISEPNLAAAPAESSGTSTSREKSSHRQHRKPKRTNRSKTPSTFGYEISDLDSFLTKASIDEPANIPVVLSQPTTLYQTQNGQQAELNLPLGTVVNAVFKNQAWLYVQTPHGHEGYVGYAACLALGILPQPTKGHCWEDSTDVFPRPLGNLTDTEKLRDTRSECGGTTRRTTTTTITPNTTKNNNEVQARRRAQSVIPTRTSSSTTNEQQRPTTSTSVRHTLLLVREDYEDKEKSETLSVKKGDVVVLLAERAPDWFWVRARDGQQGFIPAAVAGHGFL